jgi:hypothetical protein
LELRMGACSHGDGAEERLDLELRLGYSWDDGHRVLREYGWVMACYDSMTQRGFVWL